MTNIATLAQLQAMNDDLAGTYVQTADIDATDTSTWNGGAGFLPIGTLATPFTGSFDGGGFTISNLFINRPSTDYVGLFGKADSDTPQVIKDVALTNVNITGKLYTGGLLGFKGILYDISGASSSGAVSGYGTAAYAVGGLIGSSHAANEVNGHRVYRCSSSVNVTASAMAGGLIGQNLGEVRECFATGSVTATLASTSLLTGIGGLIGVLGITGQVSLCFSTGNVTGTGKMGVGGFIGYGSGGYETWVSSCYSLGNVTGTNGTQTCYAAGFIGKQSTSTALESHGCYSAGTVSGTATKGAFVGRNLTSDATAFYTDCFWDSTLYAGASYGENALGTLDEITGLTTTQMGSESNFPVNTTDGAFTNWDTGEWIFNDGYPHFIWNEPPAPPVAVGFWTRLGGTTQTFS